jgi:hypothetical protein
VVASSTRINGGIKLHQPSRPIIILALEQGRIVIVIEFDTDPTPPCAMRKIRQTHCIGQSHYEGVMRVMNAVRSAESVPDAATAGARWAPRSLGCADSR